MLDRLFRCRACAAKDAEIARLLKERDMHLARVFVMVGQPPNLGDPPPLDVPVPTQELEPPPAWSREDEEYERGMNAIAEKRGLETEQFADA